MNRVALLPVLALLLATPALAAPPVWAPYVQAGTPTSMTVMWRSAAPVAGKLSYATGKGDGQTVTGPVEPIHQFKLEGLRPGVTYRYDAYEGEERIGGGTFRTNPPPTATGFRFVAFGDSGAANRAQAAIARRITAWKPDFAIHTGDVVYERGELENYGPRFFAPYRELVARAVLYPSLGNHDYGTRGAAPYLAAFEAPRARPDETERWYTFNYGPAQFFALDTNSPFSDGTAQYRWLAAQLAASQAPWKFAFFHHPPYSGGMHGGSPYVRRAWGPLFAKHRVQVVFTGHDHHYERNRPVDGVTYVVTGGGGAWTRPAKATALTAVVKSAWHYLAVTVEGDRLAAEAIDDAGAVIDAWQVNKI